MGFSLCCLGVACSAGAANIADLRVGERASTNIVAPVRLLVADPAATARVHEDTAARVPAVFRLDPSAVQAVEQELDVALDDREAVFRLELALTFPSARTADLVEQPEFTRFCNAFLARPQNAALHPGWLKVWAADEPDEVLRGEWIILLRAFMERQIRSDRLPEAGKAGSGMVWLVPADAALADADEAQVAAQSRPLKRSDLVPLSLVRDEMIHRFASDRRDEARFLAGLLRPNCQLDEALTKRLRAQSAVPYLAAIEFAPGDTIIRAGEMVDPVTRAALDQLQEHFAARENWLVAGISGWLRKYPGPVVGAGGLLVVVVLGLFAAAWRRRGWQPVEPVALLTSANTAALTCPSCATPITARLTSEGRLWEARALLAEERAEQAQSLVRQGLLPHLAQWLKQHFLQALLSQRRQAVDANEQAAAELVELEQRLLRLHAPLVDKLRAYERRIAILERQLATRPPAAPQEGVTRNCANDRANLRTGRGIERH